MGNILASMHEEHKARQLRIKLAAFKAVMIPTIEAKLDTVMEVIIEPDIEPDIPDRSRWGSFEIIMSEICKYYKVRKTDLLSPRRFNNIARARHVLAFVAFRLTKLTTHQMAPRMDRDPSTVLYGIRKVEADLPNYQTEIDEIEARLKDLVPQQL